MRKHTIISSIVFSNRTSLLVLFLFRVGLVLSASYTVRLIFLLIKANKHRPLQLELGSTNITVTLSTLALFSIFTGFIINFQVLYIELEFGSNRVYRSYRFIIAAIGVMVSIYFTLSPKKIIPLILSNFVKNLSWIFYRGRAQRGEGALVLSPHRWGLSNLPLYRSYGMPI